MAEQKRGQGAPQQGGREGRKQDTEREPQRGQSDRNPEPHKQGSGSRKETTREV